MRFELVSELLEKVGVHGELVIQLGIDHVSKAIRVRWSYSIPRSSDTTRYASPSIVNRTSTHHWAGCDRGRTDLLCRRLVGYGSQRCLEGLLLLWGNVNVRGSWILRILGCLRPARGSPSRRVEADIIWSWWRGSTDLLMWLRNLLQRLLLRCLLGTTIGRCESIAIVLDTIHYTAISLMDWLNLLLCLLLSCRGRVSWCSCWWGYCWAHAHHPCWIQRSEITEAHVRRVVIVYVVMWVKCCLRNLASTHCHPTRITVCGRLLCDLLLLLWRRMISHATSGDICLLLLLLLLLLGVVLLLLLIDDGEVWIITVVRIRLSHWTASIARGRLYRICITAPIHLYMILQSTSTSGVIKLIIWASTMAVVVDRLTGMLHLLVRVMVRAPVIHNTVQLLLMQVVVRHE